MYDDFVSVVAAGEAVGDSAVVTGSSWQSVWNTTEFSEPVWDIVIDVPESLIAAYLANTSADFLFVGAEKTDAGTDVFYGDQWSERANIRVVIDTPPQTAPWIVVETYGIDVLVPLTAPVLPVQTVTVTDAGTGALSWTAGESPAVSWLSISGGSGGDGGSFDVQVDVTGMTAGTYTTTINVSDPAANNNPQSIPVKVTVLDSAQPLIALSPGSIAINVGNTSPVLAPIPVTVTNSGLGTLSWTASVQGVVSWLSVSSATGGDGDAFNVNINHTSLGSGTFSATIEVADASAANSPKLLTVDLDIRDQDANANQANSYDDAWETGPDGWVAYCSAVNGVFTGSEGFVVHCGDSITYANQYGRWAQSSNGKTIDDDAICTWMHAYEDTDLWSQTWTPTTNYTLNGWQLARYDRPGGRSFTAESGIRSDQ